MSNRYNYNRMKKLLKYSNFNTETGKITGIEKKAFLFTENIPADYTDFHSIENISAYGARADMDFQQIYITILELAVIIGFSNLSTPEKDIIANYLTDESKKNEFLAGTLDLSAELLRIEIEKGILLRKQIGNQFVESNYSSIMLSVAMGTANEETANLVENAFSTAISHLQNGLFISSYNAIQLVNPTEITQDAAFQTLLTNLKAEYSATVLQLCYTYYPVQVLQNTPSIPQQTP